MCGEARQDGNLLMRAFNCLVSTYHVSGTMSIARIQFIETNHFEQLTVEERYVNIKLLYKQLKA